MKTLTYQLMITLNLVLSTLALRGVSYAIHIIRRCREREERWHWTLGRQHMKLSRQYAYISIRCFNVRQRRNELMRNSTALDCLAKIGVNVSTVFSHLRPHTELILLTSPSKPLKAASSMTTSRTIDVLYPTSPNP